VVCSVDKFYMAQVSKQSHTQTMQAKDIKDNSTQDKMGREAHHCFLQESDSVCTTVLTVTMSKKETALRAVFGRCPKTKPRFARFFGCTVYQKI